MEADRNNKHKKYIQKINIMCEKKSKECCHLLPSTIFSVVAALLILVSISKADADPNTCSAPEGVDCRVNALLTEIEKAGSELKSFQAEMKYDVLDPLSESQRIRTGQLYYQVKEDVVYARIHFDDLVQLDLMDEDSNPKPVKFNEDYYFDGLWVHRSNTQTKTIERWEVSLQRQARQSFRLGQGPFPLPFAITKSDVLEFFTVKIVSDEQDEANKVEKAIHMLLMPKPDTKYAEDYTSIEFWVNESSYFPVKIKYEEKDYIQTAVMWTNIKTDKKIKDSIFKTPSVPNGWTETVHPYEQ